MFAGVLRSHSHKGGKRYDKKLKIEVQWTLLWAKPFLIVYFLIANEQKIKKIAWKPYKTLKI